MTNNDTIEPPEPGQYATAALDLKLREWRRAPAQAPVPLELHLLRTGIADFIDHERAYGKTYAEAHAALLAVVTELPTPTPPTADEAAVEALAASLGTLQATTDPHDTTTSEENAA